MARSADQAADLLFGSPAQDARAASMAVVGINPDSDADLQRKAQSLGIPIESARRDPQGFEQRVRETNTDWDEMARTRPITTRLMGSASKAAIAQDDVANMAELERKFGSIRAQRQPEPGIGSYIRGLATSTVESFRQIRAGIGMMADDLIGDMLPGFTPRQQRAAGMRTRSELDYLRSAGRTEASTPAFESGTASAVYGGLQSLLQTAPSVALTFANPVLGLTAMGAQTQAPAYAKYRSRGATPGEATLGSVGEGGVEVATEMLPMSFLVSRFGKAGAGEFLTGLVGRELPSEQVATFVQDAIDTAVANPDKTWADFWRERPDAAYNTAVATLVQSGVMGGLHTVGTRLRKNEARAAQAEADRQTIADLGQLAAASKVRQRDAATFRDFIEQAAEGSPVEDIYVNPQTLGEVLNQSGLDETQQAAALEMLGPRVTEAMQAGTDVRIPVADFTTLLAGTPAGEALLDHIKTDPNGMTKAEADEFMSSKGEQLQKEIDDALTAQSQETEREASANVVRDRVLEQLGQANRFTPAVNERYAELHGAFYSAMAARLGTTAEELYERFPVRVQATAPTGDALEQAASLPVEVRVQQQRMLEDARRVASAAGLPLDFIDDVYVVGSRASGKSHDNSDYDFVVRFTGDINNPAVLKGWDALAEHFKDTDTVLVNGRQHKADIFVTDELYSGQAAVGSQSFAQSPAWVSGIDAALSGKRTIGFLDMGGTPSVLVDMGLPAAPLVIGRAKIATIRDKHRVPAEVFHNLPELLADPLAVFPSADPNHASTLIAQLDARDIEGNPIIAAIMPDTGKGNNVVLSAYGKERHGSKTGDDIVARMIAAEERKGNKVYKREASPGRYSGPIPDISPARQKKPILSLRSKDKLDQEARGAYSPSTDTITLLASADLSTFLHESGHFFLEVMHRLASSPDAPQGVKDDFGGLLDWFGVDAETWNGMSLEEKREHHEKFARGFEAYLYTGKAPAVRLQNIFRAFRAWLVAVYRRAANLNVTVSPSVRGVMDRMLASADEIAEAENARSMMPLFENREQSGMTEDQWRDYQRTGEQATAEATEELEARSLRDMRWLNNARGREVNRLKREADAVRKAVRQQVAAEVAAEPVYAARLYLTRGLINGDKAEGPHRLALPELPELEAMYGDTPAFRSIRDALGSGGYGMVSRENGVHPEQVAELFGFSSADHMIRELMAAEPMNEKIEGLVEKRLLEEHGDLTDPQSIDEAADRAIHNEARARFVAAELSALSRASGKPKTLATAARQFARATIDRLRYRDIRPAMYEAAAARAARAAQKAMADGNLTAAASEKRNQLINTYAAREAIRAREDVEKMVDYFRRFDRPGAAKSIDPSYLEQIHGLLEAVDLKRSTTLRAIDRKASLAEWIEKQRELGFEPIIPDELVGQLQKRSYKEMTVEELRGLRDAIQNIEHLGRLKTRLLTAKKDRDFGQAVDRAVNAIRGNAVTTREQELEHGGWIKSLKRGALDFLAMHRKFASVIRQMDGFKDGGPLWELFIRPMNEAGDREAAMRADATRRIAEILKPLSGWTQKEFVPAIGASLSLEGRMAIALNMGNSINRERVLMGDKWSADQLDAIASTLTAEQWGVVQQLWDFVNSYWPDVETKERRVTGVAPEKVDAEPLRVTTSDGQTLDLRGGYYPIKYDAERSTQAEAHGIAEFVANGLRGAYTRATTRRGHTKERVNTVKRPVRKDLGVLTQHVTEVVHDLAWHEYLIDANRLLRAKPIDGAIRDHYGPETLRAFRKVLEDMAAGDVPAANSFERGLNYLRTGVTVAGMGWSVTTALMQPLGLSQSIKRIGPKWVGRGLSRWLGDAARMESTLTWIREQSPFMTQRAATQQREISEIRNTVSDANPYRRMVQESFFIFIAKLQLIADVPTWVGQYEKSIAAGEDHERAVALADQAVLDSQGGGQIKDLAGIQRGGPLQKLWTNFYSYFSVTYNLAAESIGETRLVGPSRLPLLAADMLLLSILPATLSTLILSALRGDGDDPEELAEEIIKSNLSYMFGMMVGLREIGSIIQSDGRASAPAGIIMQQAAAFYKQASQGELDEAFWKATNRLGGILFHYPAAQIQRTTLGFKALSEGKTHNPLALLLGPPPKK
ncbi:hypothetical protein BSL82_10190 [Tardibacter chloracetimidivorans]|uniref:Uncharacterized protein n=1 Tax=Tardibacter chloracetimidivorans TaxID=1921510 RepID=A0A1L3ZVI6_9SPHN|nr:hypothetical protein [Tardibacter chloracetimidivorans]API59642.1 hypothetical protein BSL82_10190 [Tardibacter chloracetimidivorans]